jgi:hypothetical protein
MELKPNKKQNFDHLTFILHGALVGVGSLWREDKEAPNMNNHKRCKLSVNPLH